MQENCTSGSMSRVGKRPASSSWFPVAACGDRFRDGARTAPNFDSTSQTAKDTQCWHLGSAIPRELAGHGKLNDQGQEAAGFVSAGLDANETSPPPGTLWVRGRTKVGVA